MNILKAVNLFNIKNDDATLETSYHVLKDQITDKALFHLYFRNMKKGKIIKALFTEKELSNIDNAVPANEWKDKNLFYYVTDFNNSIFGKVTNLIDVFNERILSKW